MAIAVLFFGKCLMHRLITKWYHDRVSKDNIQKEYRLIQLLIISLFPYTVCSEKSKERKDTSLVYNKKLLLWPELTGSACSGIEKAQAEPMVWDAPNIEHIRPFCVISDWFCSPNRRHYSDKSWSNFTKNYNRPLIIKPSHATICMHINIIKSLSLVIQSPAT